MNRVLEIFSLTGAGFNCSSYQQPGLRRGEVFGNTKKVTNLLRY